MNGWNTNADFNNKRIETYGKLDPDFLWQRPVTSLQDVARLNIAFLHQRILRAPYYGTPFETNERSNTFLRELTDINKNLFVTVNGQAHEVSTGLSHFDGLPFEERQRPYVSGFLDSTIAMQFLHHISHVPQVKFNAYGFVQEIYISNFRSDKVVVTQDRAAGTPQAVKRKPWIDETNIWNDPAQGWGELETWLPYAKGTTALTLANSTCFVNIVLADWNKSNLHSIVLDALAFARTPGGRVLRMADIHRATAIKYTRADYLQQREP